MTNAHLLAVVQFWLWDKNKIISI